MKWFKFYGQDFLTDPKMKSISVEEKMCWIVLLCLANAEEKDGKICFVSETDIMDQAGIKYDSPAWRSTLGFLGRFSSLQMITVCNEMITEGRYNILLSNFGKRQETAMSGYERVKKHRIKAKTAKNLETMITNDNGNDNAKMITNDNVEKRVDKNRVEEKRKDKEGSRPKDQPTVAGYFSELGSTEAERDASDWWDHFSAVGWLVGKKKAPMKDWKATCRTWIKNKERFNGSTHNRSNGKGNSQTSRATFEHGEADVERFRDLQATLRADSERRSERTGLDSKPGGE